MAVITVDEVDGLDGAIGSLDQTPWKQALVFAGSHESLTTAGSLLRERLPGIGLAGCTASGIFDRRTRVHAAVQLILFGGDGLSSAVAVAPLDAGGGDASREAGRIVGHAVDELDRRFEHTALILLVDGLAGDANHVVRGAYEVAGATVPIVGGCAGDNLAMESTHQLCDAVVTTRSAVGIALTSTGPIGIGMRHGWSPIGVPMTVTAAGGTSIFTLDDRPALDVYLDAVDTPQLADEDGFAAFCQTRPLGLESRNGYHVRFVRAVDFERRSIEFLVAIPEGELVTLMEGGPGTVLAAASSAVTEAVSQLSDTPIGLVAFDCVACRGVIGDAELASETEAVSRHVPASAALGGFYTYGEIARKGGNLGFHNQTMVVLALQ
jgi:hypothetical protein